MSQSSISEELSPVGNWNIPILAGLGKVFNWSEKIAQTKKLFSSTQVIGTPQDIRFSQPISAEAIYSGLYTFSGHSISLNGEIPFVCRAVPVEWAVELHSFKWLYQLNQSESKMARISACALIHDWIKIPKKQLNPIAWRSDVVSERLYSWLAYSPLLLEDCSPKFARDFHRSIDKHVRYLRRSVNLTPISWIRLKTLGTLAVATICLSGHQRFLPSIMRTIDRELNSQILPDGGHRSRNPKALVEILSILLPLRQLLETNGIEPTESLFPTIARMLPMVRFFQHQDGNLARFNGMGTGSVGTVEKLLSFGESEDLPLEQANYSGYQRISAAQSTLIMDTGGVPAREFSSNLQAGCLSFEFSSGLNEIIVNCGSHAAIGNVWCDAARSTAAHSTATIGKFSSCKFAKSQLLKRFPWQSVNSGPKNILENREETEKFIQISASHDGFAKDCGYIHDRTLSLTRDGDWLEGLDRFVPLTDDKQNPEFVIRFHMHPDIQVSIHENGKVVTLRCQNSDEWVFQSPDVELHLEESISFSDDTRHQKSNQIVIYGNAGETSTVSWILRKLC